MNQKTVGLTLRALIIALAFILAASPGLPLLDGVAYAQLAGPTLVGNTSPANDAVNLSWNVITGATGYQVVKQDRSVGTWSAPMDVSTNAYRDDDVTAGKTYGYYVRAVEVTGAGTDEESTTEGTWSNYVEVAIPGGTAAPTTVLTLTPTPSSLTSMDLTWTADPVADHYDLRFWTGSEWERIGGDLTTNSYTHTGLTSGEQYFYIVRAVNAGGNGPWQSQPYPSETLAATTTVPVLSLEHLSRERVKLTWTLVGEGAQYDLQRETDVAATGGTPADVAWARLPDSLLTVGEYTDEAAVYVSGSEGTTYRYRVFAVVDGVQGDFSNTMSVAIPSSGVLPPVPGNLSASATNSTTVVVTWGDVPVAASYELRFKTGDGNWGNAFTASSPYTHSGRSAGTTYTYQVRSRNINGHSSWSGEDEVETPAATTGSGLQTPRNLRAVDATEDGTAKVTVTWSGVSGANSYELRIWDNSDSWDNRPLGADADEIAKAVMDRSVTLEAGTPAIAANTTYYFVIRARKVTEGSDTNLHTTDDVELETSDWSAPVSVMTDALDPLAPTALDVIPQGESSIWLSWTPGTVTPGTNGDPTSYTIQWRQGTSQARQSITVEGRTNYLHTGRSPNTEYHYRVRANNNGGTTMSGWWPDENTGKAPAATDCSDTTLAADVRAQCAATEESGKTAARQLQPPSNIMTEAMSDTEIKLSWSAVAGASGYEIQRWDGSAWAFIDASGDGDAANADNATEMTTFTHTGLTSTAGGVTEYYIVRTLSSGGVMSQWSGVVTGMTKSSVPGAPTFNLLPTGQTTVRIAWANAADVAGITGYDVQFAEGVATADQFADNRFASQTISLGASPMYYLHTGLKSGTRYTYRIRATLPNDVNGTWAAPAQVMTRPGKPELTATATVSTTVNLMWDAVSFVTDPASPTADELDVLADYQIQRRASTDDTATTGVDETVWADVTAGFTDGSCATKCALVDEGRAAGVTYFYRIRVNLEDAEVTDAPGVTSYWDMATARTPSN